MGGGGEEFIVVLPGTTAEGARKAGSKLMEAVRATPFYCEGRAIGLTASSGGTGVHEGDEGADALIARADRALYAAKHDGRDRQTGRDAPDPRDLRACR